MLIKDFLHSSKKLLNMLIFLLDNVKMSSFNSYVHVESAKKSILPYRFHAKIADSSKRIPSLKIYAQVLQDFVLELDSF